MLLTTNMRVRVVMPLMQRLRLAIPKMQRIWSRSALAQQGVHKELEDILVFEMDTLKHIEEGGGTFDDIMSFP